MREKASNEQALIEPTSERASPRGSSVAYDDDTEDYTRSSATSYWYLQVLVVVFMLVHTYTLVMLCICPLGDSSTNTSSGGASVSASSADGYGQCSGGGLVPTPWSMTSAWHGWTNITLDVSSGNIGWWKGIVVLGVFAMSLTLFFASYIKASCSDPGYVMHLSKNEEVLEDHHTYCSLCNVYKPPRCHHCSRCDRCVLKMDHHCIWINNCVGLYNYKHFFQLLVHGLIGVSFIAGVFGWRIVQVYTHPTDDVLTTWQRVFLFVALGLALLQISGIIHLLVFHVQLAAKGRTNVEQVYEYYKDEDTNYDQGCTKNCVLALDSPALCWFNPCCGISPRYIRRNFDASQ